MTVTTTLLRIFRPIVLWFVAIILAVEVIAVVAISSVGPMKFSFWLLIASAAAKYWPLVAGVLLVSMYFKVFVANGVTRHEFLRGLALVGVAMTFVFPAAVVIGHAAESITLGLLDLRASGYPAFRFGEAAGEFAHLVPATAAYVTSGVLLTAVFYRFRPWLGVLLILPGAAPLLLTGWLLNLDEFGALFSRYSFTLALTVSLGATLAGCLAIHRIMRDVAIRRTAG
ncbi:hypothetical protein [Actinoplanes solisilvae]|uniref:hypothetical protein n=1 Tax=Actinoplanes solisilvae TaxID=2486853 RepID=UPI000FD994B3|nr:hypothetical protein [Actinoplanes solisilvae]